MTLPIQTGYSLRQLNTFGIDAHAAAYLRVTEDAMLDELRRDPRLSSMPRVVLGGGSNMLFTRDVDGLVVHMATSGIEVVGEDGDAVFIRARAGENWHGFVRHTLALGLPGLENLSLIPGCVGASPIQNIGAYGAELKDCFHSLHAYDLETGTTFALDRQACRFGYRDSIFKHELAGRAIILDVTFALPRRWQPNLRYAELAQELAAQGKTAPDAIDVSNAVIAIRTRKLPDPAVIGNAGSFFKNPVVSSDVRCALLAKYPALVSYAQPDGTFKLAAGWLIDQCGWKGRSIGAAGVYEKQALVLVNRGGAQGRDIVGLAEAVQSDVMQRFGVMLEPEPVFI